MHHNTGLHIKKFCTLGGVFLCVCLTSAFSFPSLQELKQDIHTRLESIWAKTPAAKEQAAWKTARQEAENALNEAKIQEDAARYAQGPLSESETLLSQADHYATAKSYYKAAYLARKAQEKAETAKSLARKTRMEKINQAKAEIDIIEADIKQLSERYQKTKSQIPIEYNELILAWRDLVHAIDIEQLHDISGKIAEIKKRITDLNAKLDTSTKIIHQKTKRKK